MIRRGDHDRVDVFLLGQHLAIIFVTLGLRQLVVFQLYHGVKLRLRLHRIERSLARSGGRRLGDAPAQRGNVSVESIEGLAGVAPIHIAERHDILRGHVDQVRAAHASHTHVGNVQRVTWRNEAAAQHVTRNDRKGSDRSRGIRQELPACDCGFSRLLRHRGMLPEIVGNRL